MPEHPQTCPELTGAPTAPRKTRCVLCGKTIHTDRRRPVCSDCHLDEIGVDVQLEQMRRALKRRRYSDVKIPTDSDGSPLF